MKIREPNLMVFVSEAKDLVEITEKILSRTEHFIGAKHSLEETEKVPVTSYEKSRRRQNYNDNQAQMVSLLTQYRELCGRIYDVMHDRGLVEVAEVIESGGTDGDFVEAIKSLEKEQSTDADDVQSNGDIGATESSHRPTVIGNPIGSSVHF